MTRRLPITSQKVMAALLSGLVLCAGCGSGTRDQEDSVGPDDKPSVSALPFAQAREMAREEAQEVLASLPDGARLEPADGDPRGSTGFCADRSDPPKGTPVNWQGNWDVEGVPLDPQLIATVADALEKRGWKRAYGSVEDGQVSYEDDRGFTMVFTVSDVRASLTEGTPCVKPADPDNPLDT